MTDQEPHPLALASHSHPEISTLEESLSLQTRTTRRRSQMIEVCIGNPSMCCCLASSVPDTRERERKSYNQCEGHVLCNISSLPECDNEYPKMEASVIPRFMNTKYASYSSALPENHGRKWIYFLISIKLNLCMCGMTISPSHFDWDNAISMNSIQMSHATFY